jgi:hypothetical protein
LDAVELLRRAGLSGDKVVLEALRTCDLPPTEVIAWCSAMLESDRVGFIGGESNAALRTHWQRAAAK